MEYRALGGLEVRRDGVDVELGPPKQRAVLAVLLLEAGRVVAVDRLVSLLWGDDTPKAEASLHTYVSNLRKALEPGRRARDPARVLVTRSPGYVLVAERDEVDAFRFEDLVEEGRACLAAGDREGANDAFRRALTLWRGPLLPELVDEAFVVAAQRRLENLRAVALEGLGETRLAAGDAAGAVTLLEPVADEYPLREHLHALLALALYRCGRQAEAVRVVGGVRAALGETTGLEPGPSLRSLEAALLAQSPELDWAPGSVRPGATATAPAPATPAPASAASVTSVAAPTAPSTPSVTGPPPLGQLVGRAEELRVLTGALDRAAAGRGGVAVVVGEPGMGKTRLVEELTALARRRDYADAWTRCPEDATAPPFWPVTQLAEQLQVAGVTADRLVAPSPGLDDTEAAAARFALHRGVALALAAAPRPVLAVVDDVHWADADSLRLLAAVAADLAASPVLVVLTTRPLTSEAPDALVDCLGEIARSRGSVHVHLSGLDAGAVQEWLAARTDVVVPPAVARLVHDRTGGHPLFVKELADLLAAEGRLGDVEAASAARAIPTGVQFVVRRRVARLPAETQRVLTVAAAIGHVVDPDVLGAATGDVGTVLDALEPACASGLVELDGDGRFRFSHALVADALAAEVNGARRARIHATVARAMAAGTGPLAGATPAQIARHAAEGAPAGTADLAIDASRAAAAAARARLADEDATAHLKRAVALLERHRPGDVSTRVTVLTELAATALRADLLGDTHAAVLAAIELADGIGDVEAMGRAAALLDSANLWPNQRYGEVDHRTVRALDRTLAALPDTATATRARVLNALTFEVAYDADRSEEVGSRAVETARACGDPVVLARSLIARHVQIWRPGRLAERRRLATDVLALAEKGGIPPDLELMAQYLLAVADVEGADLDAAESHLARCWALAETAGTVPYRGQLGHTEAAIHGARGRYEQAYQVGMEGVELYRRTRGHDAEMIALGLVLGLQLDRGGLEETLAQVRNSPVDNRHYVHVFVESLAFLYVEIGRPDDAAAVLGGAGARGEPPRDWAWTHTTTLALHTRAGLGRRDEAAALLEQLRPFAGQLAVPGSGPVIGGLVDLALARAAALLGDTDRAAAWFASSIAGHERLRMPAWLARSLVHHAAFLRARGGPGDGEAAAAALARAEALAAEHGLVYVAAAIHRAS